MYTRGTDPSIEPTLTVERQLLQMEPESNYYAELKALVVCGLQEGQRGRKFLGVRAARQSIWQQENPASPGPQVRATTIWRPSLDKPSTSPRQTNKQTVAKQ